MKQINTTIILILVLLLGLSVKAQDKNVTIKGNFPQWNRGPVVLLYSEKEEIKQDTTDIINGKFTFKLKLAEPSRVSVYSIAAVQGQTKDNIGFYADQGTVYLNGRDSLAHAKIKGSRITEEGIQLSNETTPIQQKMIAIRAEAMAVSKDDVRYAELIKNLNDAYRTQIEAMIAAKENFIKQHPNSFLSLITLNEFMGGAIDYDFVSPLLNGLATPLQKTTLAKEMQNKLVVAKRTNIGAILPNFESKDTLGNAISLMEVVGHGKYTLIDFWASWCLPCRKENPNIVKAYQAFHNKGFNILSVSLDKSGVAWKKAIVQDNMSWYHASSLQYWDEPAAKLYGISGVPDSFLVDAEGRVIARGLRAEALYAKLQELLD